MSNRTERRAAEHASRKLAYKELRQQQTQPAISEIQLAANQANAQLSHGPVTPRRESQIFKKRPEARTNRRNRPAALR